MFSIDITGLRGRSPADLIEDVRKLAAHIRLEKELKHVVVKVGECSLQALDQKRESDAPSLELVEDLNSILKRVIEMGIDENLRRQLDTIRKLHNKILMALPLGNIQFSDDTLREVLAKMTPAESGRLRRVSKTWQELVPLAQIRAINEGRLPLRKALRWMDGTEAIQWLIANPACGSLEYADFSGDDRDHNEEINFDNNCLQLLTQHCPNLKYLSIPDTNISDDVLKFLEKIPKLQCLDISGCDQIERDALKHLKFTPELLSLNICWCDKLEVDALKHLANTPLLQFLNIRHCEQLSLDHLPATLSFLLKTLKFFNEE